MDYYWHLQTSPLDWWTRAINTSIFHHMEILMSSRKTVVIECSRCFWYGCMRSTNWTHRQTSTHSKGLSQLALHKKKANIITTTKPQNSTSSAVCYWLIKVQKCHSIDCRQISGLFLPYLYMRKQASHIPFIFLISFLHFWCRIFCWCTDSIWLLAKYLESKIGEELYIMPNNGHSVNQLSHNHMTDVYITSGHQAKYMLCID